MNLYNYLTIDVEDYFQVSAFEPLVSKESWDTYPSRVTQNTQKILSILEKHNIKATFFILGWTANKHPEIVKEIARNGHEIACHSYYHRLVYNLTPDEFQRDTLKAKETLEQITGVEVKGYRAPSYSITRKSLWAIQILEELGFNYDSSIFPIHHDRYGIPGAPRYPFFWKTSGDLPEIGDKYTEEENRNTTHSLIEYPISTAMFFGKNLPVSGGGYFRLFPYWFTKLALRKINEQEKKNFIFYLHPWEFDPDQPRFNQASLFSKFRHYNNLGTTETRFERLLNDFTFGPMYLPSPPHE
jgi:polysaccharide deacetylase family protein (PEP-CTERM system associated)